MNKLLKSISISLAGAIVMMFFLGCTPGKAQTRTNDYNGSFQSEEFEAFEDGSSANDDEIPSMNRNKSSNKNEKYADNNKPRVKSDSGYGSQKEKGYKEVKGNYSESSDFDDESDSSAGNNEKFFQKGTASWYGREFHGKTTASGEKFDMNDMTAAHKTLPFGTIVEVKNMDNGKSVRLKINDRGPYRGNRIIDLSLGGAKEIGMVKSGEANVAIKVLKMGSAGSAVNKNRKYVEPVADDEPYARVKNSSEYDHEDSAGVKLQAGAFYSRKNAETLKSRIEGMTDRTVKVVQDGDFYKVRIEGLRDKREMNRLKSTLSEESISSFAVE